jgi:tetratricopeptide (TPR) repeat protein
MHDEITNLFQPIHVLLSKGKPRQALNRLLDPSSAKLRQMYAFDKNHAWYCVGNAEFNQCNYQEAVIAYRKAYRAEHGDINCLIAIGNCYDAQWRPKLAERVLRQALLLEPKGVSKATVICNLANALFDQKKYIDAAKMYELITSRKDVIGLKAKTNRKRAIELTIENKK